MGSGGDIERLEEIGEVTFVAFAFPSFEVLRVGKAVGYGIFGFAFAVVDRLELVGFLSEGCRRGRQGRRLGVSLKWKRQGIARLEASNANEFDFYWDEQEVQAVNRKHLI